MPLRKLIALITGEETHECAKCAHIIPSQRARWHAGYKGFYFMKTEKNPRMRGPHVSVSRRLKIVSYK